MPNRRARIFQGEKKTFSAWIFPKPRPKKRYAEGDPQVVAYVLALKKMKDHNEIELDNALQKLRGIVGVVEKSFLKGFLDKISK